MHLGFRILDVDRHVMEPNDLWQRYLPKRFREFAPKLISMVPADETLPRRLKRLGEHALLPMPHVLAVGDEPIMRGMSEVAYIETALIGQQRLAQLAAGATPEGQLADMDATGVDLAVLLPTFASFLVYNDAIDAERSRAYAEAYNRWLKEFCSAAPKRLLGAALISRHEPAMMAADLSAAVRDGFRAITIRPNPVGNRTLSSPDYAAFWKACESHSVAVLIHEGTHARVVTAGADRFSTHFGQHACSHPMEAMMAILSLIEGGVFEAHPGLRVGFLEAGCSWLPYWLWRLDHVEYSQYSAEVRSHVRRAPSEYFRRQCWIALEPDEPLLAETLRDIDASRAVFGSDFPHLDHSPRVVSQMVAERGRLGDDVLRTLLWQSPCALMGLDWRTTGAELEPPHDGSRTRPEGLGGSA